MITITNQAGTLNMLVNKTWLSQIIDPITQHLETSTQDNDQRNRIWFNGFSFQLHMYMRKWECLYRYRSMKTTYLVTIYVTYCWLEIGGFLNVGYVLYISSSTIHIESSTSPTSSAFDYGSNSSSPSLILRFLFRLWFSFSCCWPLSMFFTSLLLPVVIFRVSLITIRCWWAP